MHISTKCSITLHCLLFIYEYGEKIKVTSELLSCSTGSNPITIRNIMSALKKDGILLVKRGTGGATLNCLPSEISLYRLGKALEPDFLSKLMGMHPSPSSLCPIGQNIHTVLDLSYEKIRNDLKVSLEKITLEKIIADYHACNNRDITPFASIKTPKIAGE